MSQQVSIKEAESQVFKLAQFQDGWWDILLGAEFIYLGFYSIIRERLGPLPNLLLFLGVLAVMVVLYLMAKRIYVAPRIGTVKMGAKQNVKKRKMWAITSLLVLSTSTVGILLATGAITPPIWMSAPAWINNNQVEIFFAAVIIAFFTGLAYLMNVARLHLYGWLLGLGNLASSILDNPFNWPLFIAGTTMALFGLVLFGRFLRDYDLPKEEI